MNAATGRLDVRSTADVTQVDTAPARRRFDSPHATLDLHVSAARLDHNTLFAGKHNHIASASLRLDLPFHCSDRDIAASRLQLQISADRSDVDRVAPGFCIH